MDTEQSASTTKETIGFRKLAPSRVPVVASKRNGACKENLFPKVSKPIPLKEANERNKKQLQSECNSDDFIISSSSVIPKQTCSEHESTCSASHSDLKPDRSSTPDSRNKHATKNSLIDITVESTEEVNPKYAMHCETNDKHFELPQIKHLKESSNLAGSNTSLHSTSSGRSVLFSKYVIIQDGEEKKKIPLLIGKRSSDKQSIRSRASAGSVQSLPDTLEYFDNGSNVTLSTKPDSGNIHLNINVHVDGHPTGTEEVLINPANENVMISRKIKASSPDISSPTSVEDELMKGSFNQNLNKTPLEDSITMANKANHLMSEPLSSSVNLSMGPTYHGVGTIDYSDPELISLQDSFNFLYGKNEAFLKEVAESFTTPSPTDPNYKCTVTSPKKSNKINIKEHKRKMDFHHQKTLANLNDSIISQFEMRDFNLDSDIDSPIPINQSTVRRKSEHYGSFFQPIKHFNENNTLFTPLYLSTPGIIKSSIGGIASERLNMLDRFYQDSNGLGNSCLLCNSSKQLVVKNSLPMYESFKPQVHFCPNKESTPIRDIEQFRKERYEIHQRTLDYIKSEESTNYKPVKFSQLKKFGIHNRLSGNSNIIHPNEAKLGLSFNPLVEPGENRQIVAKSNPNNQLAAHGVMRQADPSKNPPLRTHSLRDRFVVRQPSMGSILKSQTQHVLRNAQTYNDVMLQNMQYS